MSISQGTDFSVPRLARYLRQNSHELTIIYQGSMYKRNSPYFKDIKLQMVGGADGLLDVLHKENFDSIIYRGWMNAYGFGGELCEEFSNVSVMIKDWNYTETREQYDFIFTPGAGDRDFDGIDKIFRHAKTVFSQHTDAEWQVWSAGMDTKARFVHMPDMCNPDKFINPKKKPLDTVKLVYAGGIGSSSTPRDLGCKNVYLGAKYMTERGVDVSFVMPPAHYDYVTSHAAKIMMQDCLYEGKFNPLWHMLRGTSDDPSVLNPYHMGGFSMEAGPNRLYQHVIVSKFSTYMEAGLPIFVHRNFEALASLTEKNGIGIIFETLDELYFLLDSMTEEQYEEAVMNVIKFREKFTYNRIEPDRYL